MSIYEVLGILFMHWVADFVLQTDEQAKGKSTEWKWLLQHTATYSFALLAMMTFTKIGMHLFTDYVVTIDMSYRIAAFVVITFVFHTLTDYYTSRLNSKLYAKGDIHNFFVSIGFDQWLHYAQLFITYMILFKWTIG